jgi:hypothetical protein
MMPNVRETQQDAFALHLLFRAWNFHMTNPEYDAWINNFHVRQDFKTFLINSKRQNSPENEAVRCVLWLSGKGVKREDFRDFVVTAFDTPTTSILNKREERLTKFKAYKDGHYRSVGTDGSDFIMVNGIPVIMANVAHQHWSPILAAAALSNSGSWERLWSMKDQSHFMFDMVWAKLHKYKPLFEGLNDNTNSS